MKPGLRGEPGNRGIQHHAAEAPEKSMVSSPGHEREWLDCIRSRQTPSCSPAYHYRIDAAIALANLPMQVGRSIRFDPASERILNDQKAEQLATPEYRLPWKFPADYVEEDWQARVDKETSRHG